jgi:excisionase family DNA binding protein
MKNLILTGVTLDELLFRIEQVIEAKFSALPHQTESQSDYITRKEVIKILKISLPTLHDWTKQGWLQSYKIGNRVLYRKVEVEESVSQVLFQKHKKIKP